MRDIKTKRLFYIAFILLLVYSIFVCFSHISAGQEPAKFSTWEGFEVDKCASIWLIKRFVDKNAEIIFYPKGEAIKEGIPFDTPEAKFRRYFNLSTYESLILHYKINDTRAKYIGKIIHDIEVNIWEKKVLKETLPVKDAVNRIIRESTNKKEVIERCNSFFDILYER